MCRLACEVEDNVAGASNWIKSFPTIFTILEYVILVVTNSANTLLVNCQHGQSRSWATVIAVILFDLGDSFLCFWKVCPCLSFVV